MLNFLSAEIHFFTDLLDFSRVHSVVSERKGTQFTKIWLLWGVFNESVKRVSTRKLWFQDIYFKIFIMLKANFLTDL
jgi:hypothetical protein